MVFTDNPLINEPGVVENHKDIPVYNDIISFMGKQIFFRKMYKYNRLFLEYVNISNNVSIVRKFGSAALDMANVACGRFDGYWQRELNYWDIAAGIIIVKEAGGFVDFFEEDVKVPLKKNILATNSNIHEELKDLIDKKEIE